MEQLIIPGLLTVGMGRLTVGDERKVTLGWRTHDEGADVTLEAPDTGRRYALEVRVTPPVGICAGALALETWSMVRGLPPASRASGDAFVRVTHWAHHELFGACDEERPQRVRVVGDRESARYTMRLLFGKVAEIARHVAERCRPDARRLALRFTPHLRLRIYRAIVDDATGRVAQVAVACPGALVFALAMAEHVGEGANAARRFFRAMVDGQRLDRALRDLVTAWAAAAHGYLREGRVPVARNPFARIVDAGERERARLMDEQRLLVRRASARANTTLVWLPPPPALTPEDVPLRPVENAAWFRVVKSNRRLLSVGRAEGEAQRTALARFASRHALAIYRRVGRRRVRAAMSELLDYVLATGRQPSRATDPERLLAECDAWHREMAFARDVLCVDGGPFDRRRLDEPLPAPPWPAGSEPGFSATPITTARALIDEGREMSHCVASRLGDVRSGESAVYRVVIDGRRLTVEIEWSFGSWRLAEVKARANHEPSMGERAKIEAWIARMNAKCTSDKEDRA